jgi:hypothetical protein
MLTTLLKASMAISRKVIDWHLADRSLQVGLSGKTVNRQTYNIRYKWCLPTLNWTKKIFKP